MIARIRKSLDEKEQGFTLIELLVVIIIIGILAAIAIPAFLNQRQKAWVSQVESDLKNAAIAAESYAVDNNGSYKDLDTAVSAAGVVTAGSDWDKNGFNGTEDVSITATIAADFNSYTLEGKNTNLDAARTFTYDSKTGVITDSANP